MLNTDELGDLWANLTEDVPEPIAERLYDQHLDQLRREGEIDV